MPWLLVVGGQQRRQEQNVGHRVGRELHCGASCWRGSAGVNGGYYDGGLGAGVGLSEESRCAVLMRC
eukprot:SAG11_NODE_2654_length_3123_cov_9.811177_2_plen_67_part_00